MAETDYPGIDYSMGRGANTDPETGIRYGVISIHEVTQSWCDSSEGDYGSPESDDAKCPSCGHNCSEPDMSWGDTLCCEECDHIFDLELPDCCEPIGHVLNDGEYQAWQGQDCDIMISKSPFYTHAQFCSPCAPGAGYLMNPCPDGPKTYCFGHDWFESGVAPYPVYSVETGELVQPDRK